MHLSETKVPDVIREVKHAVIGKDETVEKMMAAILVKGHVLIEDIPGVGKTTMALAFAKAMQLQQKRMQFTPDVLPSDVTGYNLYDPRTGTSVYQKGPIMTEFFLADEINRTSPKTQSALLEVMEERSVTIEGRTMPVPEPFLVVATQNPFGSFGTQPLPDSQMDRFMISLRMGYPTREDERTILKRRNHAGMTDGVHPAMDKQELLQIQAEMPEIYIEDSVYGYLQDLVEKTRNHPLIQIGVSPRGALALARMAQGVAFLRNRDYVLPEDVRTIFSDVARHRLVLDTKARLAQKSAEAICEEVLGSVHQPQPWSEKYSHKEKS